MAKLCLLVIANLMMTCSLRSQAASPFPNGRENFSNQALSPELHQSFRSGGDASAGRQIKATSQRLPDRHPRGSFRRPNEQEENELKLALQQERMDGLTQLVERADGNLRTIHNVDSIHWERVKRFGVVVGPGKKFWVLKSRYYPGRLKNRREREFLYFLLSSNLMNVGEIRYLSPAEFADLPGLAGPADDYYLARLLYSSNIDPGSVVHRAWDEAFNGWLAAAVYFRNFDIHIDNVAFGFGVPFGFDNEMSFIDVSWEKFLACLCLSWTHRIQSLNEDLKWQILEATLAFRQSANALSRDRNAKRVIELFKTSPIRKELLQPLARAQGITKENLETASQRLTMLQDATVETALAQTELLPEEAKHIGQFLSGRPKVFEEELAAFWELITGPTTTFGRETTSSLDRDIEGSA